MIGLIFELREKEFRQRLARIWGIFPRLTLIVISHKLATLNHFSLPRIGNGGTRNALWRQLGRELFNIQSQGVRIEQQPHSMIRLEIFQRLIEIRRKLDLPFHRADQGSMGRRSELIRFCRHGGKCRQLGHRFSIPPG